MAHKINNYVFVLRDANLVLYFNLVYATPFEIISVIINKSEKLDNAWSPTILILQIESVIILSSVSK